MHPQLSHAPTKTCHSPPRSLLDNLRSASHIYSYFLSFSPATKFHSHMTIFTPSSDNADLFPPHLSHPSFPPWLRSVPSPQHRERLMLLRLVNPEGEEPRDRHGDKDSDRHGRIRMNTHICIISERKRYKYTRAHKHKPLQGMRCTHI